MMDRLPMRWTALLIALCGLIALCCASANAQEAPRIVQIVITGNQTINSDVIQNTLTFKVGDKYSDDEVEKSRSSIMSLGYFSAVTFRKQDAAGGNIVTFEVIENPKVTEIKISGSYPVPEAKILELMKVKAGQILNTNTMRTDLDAIQNYYADNGYYGYVTENVAMDSKTGVLTIPVLVNKVESVEITGNTKTKSYVFLREMKTKAGAILSLNDLKDDYRKIYALDILEEIKPYQINPSAQIGSVKVVIPVVEKKTGQVSLGLGYSSRQKLVGQVRVSETNFRGRGQGINALWEQGTTEAVGGSGSYELGFYEPWLDKKNTALSVNVFDKINYRFSSGVFNSGTLTSDKIYNERHKGGDVTLSRPISDKIRLFLSGKFERVDTDPSLLVDTGDFVKIVQKGDVKSGTLKAVRETRDYPIDAATGSYGELSFELGSVNAVRFGPAPTLEEIPFSGPYNKTVFEYRQYWSKGGKKVSPQDKRTTLATRIRMGYGNGKIPFFEQFFVGGGESLRGYKEDRFWGTKMLLASVELRKPIAQSISGVLFVDYGDAWDSAETVNIGEFSQEASFHGFMGAGLGMRVNTPIGNIRLDYGKGREGARTHFSIGQAF